MTKRENVEKAVSGLLQGGLAQYFLGFTRYNPTLPYYEYYGPLRYDVVQFVP